MEDVVQARVLSASLPTVKAVHALSVYKSINPKRMSIQIMRKVRVRITISHATLRESHRSPM